ncbi:phosphonate ABC transporter, permease protein PhnE [Blastochloris viridis]|uniref:Phosphate-import permease protein phnE n=1 Tax=Blastochloris viridis TaxID=1079 RepID=A0A0H5BFT2_BLAVI|nr:phosphonate ABC transporter, permease protein PhnE [Blastochloris viridis]ALK09062.1 Phosphate-import permease protein PhnE [Blastochloris viridis]BAS01076.1 phosphonate ABC transporter permease protein phnE2 [Blastochloris viridis]CUU41724.1 Phosphate-import permease protein phnE [Blastochloris viridis]
MAPSIHRQGDARLALMMGGYDAAVAAKRRQTTLGATVLIVAVVVAALVGEVDVGKFVVNLHRFGDYIVRLAHLEGGAGVLSDVGEWFWGWRRWLVMLGETLLIAYMGTLMGALGGFALCFFAARNLTGRAWVRFATKRFFEVCRTVPEMVFALIFVIAFGLGPLAGVLALAVHSTGALGKLFCEVVENIDLKPVDGVKANGGSWVEAVRFAVVPQVLSNFASYALLRFEVNVRSAAVMGFVGAGGIGQDLIEAIRKFYYSDVSALLVLIVGTVMVIDLCTERLRHALLGLRRA